MFRSTKTARSLILCTLLTLSVMIIHVFPCLGSETRDVAIIELTFSPSGDICLATVLNADVTVENQGNFQISQSY